jgi:hypothetical protein
VNARTIRGWLLQRPKPSMLRLTTGDGEPQELRPAKSFAKTAETIEALNPELIEALDDKGRLIRATSLREPESDTTPAVVPTSLSEDPETARLTHFANLIARAYEHSTDVAFQKLVDVVERIGDRSEAIEQRLERAEAAWRREVNRQIDDAFDRAEEREERAAEAAAPDLGTQLAQNFLGGALGAGVRPPAKARPNGAVRKEGES